MQSAQVINPLGVELQIEEAWASEGIGLEDAEQQQAHHAGQDQVWQGLQQAVLALFGGECEGADQHGSRQANRHGKSVQLGGHRQAESDPESQAGHENGVVNEAGDPSTGPGGDLVFDPQASQTGFRPVGGLLLSFRRQHHAHGIVERQKGKEVDKRVHGEEVGLLNLQHCHC